MFRNKTVIISGGSGDVGKAIIREMAKEGANISFNYFNNKDGARKLEQESRNAGAKIKSFKVDIKDYTAVQKWVQKTKEYFGSIDIIINNAATLKPASLAFTKKKDWQKVLDTNLGGLFNLTQCAIFYLIKQKSGNIINIASISGIIGTPPVNYAASKGGIIAFSKCLAREVATYNIRVNTIAPGYVKGAMLDRSMSLEQQEKMLKKIPLERFAQPQEIAALVKFLAGKKSRYITGQTIVIDGGYTLCPFTFYNEK